MEHARLAVVPELYDRVRLELLETGLFANGDEFDDFANSVLLNRRLTYRAVGKSYPARYMLLDEIENLVDQLLEMADDYKHQRDKRKRKVSPGEAGAGAVPRPEAQGEEAGAQAASVLRRPAS